MKQIILFLILILLAVNAFSATAVITEKRNSPYYYETEIELGLTKYKTQLIKFIPIEGLEFEPSSNLIQINETSNPVEKEIYLEYVSLHDKQLIEEENELIPQKETSIMYLMIEIELKEFPETPLTEEYSIQLNFGPQFDSPGEKIELPEINLKLNYNEPGIILAADLYENHELIEKISEKKGWKIEWFQIIEEEYQTELMLNIREKLIQEYNENPFEYLLIIASEYSLPELDYYEWFFEAAKEETNINYAPLDYMFFSTIPIDYTKFDLIPSNIAIGRIPFEETDLIEKMLDKKPVKSRITNIYFPDESAIKESNIYSEMNTYLLGNLPQKLKDSGDYAPEELFWEERVFLFNPTETQINEAINKSGIININAHGIDNSCINIEPKLSEITKIKEWINENIIGKPEKRKILSKEEFEYYPSKPFIQFTSCNSAKELLKSISLSGASGTIGYLNTLPLQKTTITKNNVSKTIGKALKLERNKLIEKYIQEYLTKTKTIQKIKKEIIKETFAFYGDPSTEMPKTEKEFNGIEFYLNEKEIQIILPKTKYIGDIDLENGTFYNSWKIPELERYTNRELNSINLKIIFSTYAPFSPKKDIKQGNPIVNETKIEKGEQVFYIIPSFEKYFVKGDTFFHNELFTKYRLNDEDLIDKFIAEDYADFLKERHLTGKDVNYGLISSDEIKKQFCFNLIEGTEFNEEENYLIAEVDGMEFPLIELNSVQTNSFKELIEKKLSVFFELNDELIEPITGNATPLNELQEKKVFSEKNSLCFNMLEIEYLNLIENGLTKEDRIKII
ncbi:MAG: hypothetical protein JW703_00570, partial [Candidatus Diapherotrites archaeon]|nr:hypothetical protein [Candidatus Diapherotrites archaeon]